MDRHFFFTDALGAGGISTNIVALASYMNSIDMKSTIVTLNSRKYSESVWNYCKQIANISSVVGLFSIFTKSRNIKAIFFANSFKTLLIAYLVFFLSVFRSHTIQIVFCTYHPLEFSKKGFWPYFYRKLVCSLGKNNIFFMNGACFSEHESVCKKGSLLRNYLPLVFPKIPDGDLDSTIAIKANILTVGRFVGFKLHYMRALLQYASIRPSIDVYFAGYGEGEPELRGYVIKKKLTNVFFLGRVEYSKLQSLYREARCYVGMGTTLVEASSYGVPSVVSVVGVPGDVCYGFFIEQNEYDVGEFNPQMPIRSMTECLDYVMSLDVDDFKLLSYRHQDFSKRFGADVIGSLYLQLCKSSNVTHISAQVFLAWLGLIMATLINYVVWIVGGRRSRYDE